MCACVRVCGVCVCAVWGGGECKSVRMRVDMRMLARMWLNNTCVSTYVCMHVCVCVCTRTASSGVSE